MEKQLKIGLFGFGCVGKGLYEVLHASNSLQGEILGICVKDKSKSRSLPARYFTYDKYELLDNPEINTIVELIDDAEAAFEIVKYALQQGKAVVSANKKMIAEHFEELYELQQKHNVSLLYEAAACASIPVIRNLEEYYDNDLLSSVEGIVNGSTNYILSSLNENRGSYAEVLREAQSLGFAESDPRLDVKGYDARYKLCLIGLHAFGIFIEPEKVFTYGIQGITDKDLRYAREKGYKIKLVANAVKTGGELHLWVMPKLMAPDNKLFNIEKEYNGICIEGAFSDRQFFSGKGAGSYPTASAVLSDISALRYGYRYEYRKRQFESELSYSGKILINLYCRFPASLDPGQLPFIEINEIFKNREHCYVTGLTYLDELNESGLLQNPDVFVGQLGEINPLLTGTEIEDELSVLV